MFKKLIFHAPPKRFFFGGLNYMFSVNSLKMINFCKNATCPSSQDLLFFEKGETSSEESQIIRKHLETCEFCAAELEFYARFPQSEDSFTETKIPLPLYQLAEALLGNHQKKFNLLKKLLSENESLTMEKA